MIIKYSDFAKNNLSNFIKYSKLSHPIDYVEELVNTILILSSQPKSGKVIFYINNIEVRQLIFKMHRIIYRIKNNEIHIGAILHTSQSLDNSLKFINQFFK